MARPKRTLAETILVYGTGIVCGYEAAAIATAKVPTVSMLVGRQSTGRKWLLSVGISAALFVHLALGLPRGRAR